MRYVLFIFILIGCASAPKVAPPVPTPSRSEAIETRDFSKVGEKVKSLSQKHGAENVLVVFDIDNTLLTMEKDLGSDPWFTWQEQMLSDSIDNSKQPDLVASNFPELLNVQGIFYSWGPMRPTSPETVKTVHEILKSSARVMVLTARGPAYRYDTLRELFRAGFNFKKRAPELSQQYQAQWLPYDKSKLGELFTAEELERFKLGDPRDVSYLWGVFSTEGQHKGVMLRVFLKKAGLNPKAIVFVDDQPRNTERVQAAFSHWDGEIVTFRYGKLDDRVQKFDKSDKAPVIRQWNLLKSSFDALDSTAVKNAVKQVWGR